MTAIIASLYNINILQDYRLLCALILGTLLPDIDTTRSTIGKLFYPLARFINTHYGHRTITHSLISLMALVITSSALQATFYPDTYITTVLALAYASHLLLDMLTVQGVPLFYPFRRNPCVVPGNPELRLRTNSITHETIAFCCFMTAAISLQPLFERGFWTSYNTLFGTTKHLASQFHKSENLLHITFTIQQGSTIQQRAGLCIAATKEQFTIIDAKKNFYTHPRPGQLVIDITPTLTNMRFSFQEGQYRDITLDSLYRLFNASTYTEFRLRATTPVLITIEDIEHKTATADLIFPNKLQVRDIPAQQKLKSPFVISPTLKLKKEEIKQTQKHHATDLHNYHQALSAHTDLTTKLTATTDPVQREILMLQLSETNKPKPPKSIQPAIDRLRLQLTAIQEKEAHRRTEHYTTTPAQPLTFSGTYVKLLINDKEI